MATPQSQASSAPIPAAAWSALAFAISAVHFARFFDSATPVYTDVRYFLYFAWRIAEGDVPHLDLFDNKTFLASLVSAGLYRLGEALGVDPLHFIRASMLALASFGGLLTYWIFRRIGHGRVVMGFLGLIALLSFGILGELPAIGNFPKLLMGLLASAAALAIARGYWLVAGACGALAFMDWQVGALVGLSALATALLSGDRRVRNVTRVIGGGLLGLAPFVLYFALHGALGVAIEQIFGMALARASDSLETVTFVTRLERIAGTAARADGAQQVLMAISLIGLPLSWAWCWRERGTSVGRLLLALCLTHTALCAFALSDFQFFGDLYVLAMTSAFWLGIVWVGLLVALERSIGPGLGRRRTLAAALIVAALLAAGPFALSPPRIDLSTLHVPRGVTLSEQRDVAHELRKRIGDKPFVALASSEMLFLMRYENPMPFVYLNVPSHAYSAKSPDETIEKTAGRLIERIDPERFAYPGRHPFPERLGGAYAPASLKTPDGDYVVWIYERK